MPLEIRSFLDDKRAAWDQRRERLTIRSVPVVAEGLHVWEEHRGERFRWTGGHVRLYVAAGGRVVTALRAIPVPRLREQRVEVYVEGRRVERITLDPGPWRPLEIELPRRVWRPGGRALVELHVAQPWRPAERFPGSRDPRVLGVQLAPVRVQ